MNKPKVKSEIPLKLTSLALKSKVNNHGHSPCVGHAFGASAEFFMPRCEGEHNEVVMKFAQNFCYIRYSME